MRRSASGACMRLLWLASLVAISAPAAIIEFSTTSLGLNGSNEPVYRYTYNLTGAQITTNQEIQIRFDPTKYKTLTNGVPSGGGSFDLVLFQPDSPPGTPGDYSLLALVPNPSMAGIFSVEFVWIGVGAPGEQPFFINQFDGQGQFISQLESGMTVSSGIPEPSTLFIGAGGLLALGLVRQSRHKRRTTDTSK